MLHLSKYSSFTWGPCDPPPTNILCQHAHHPADKTESITSYAVPYQLNSLPYWWGLKYPDCMLCRGVRPSPHLKGWFGYDIKMHLMLKLQFWRSGNCVVQLHVQLLSGQLWCGSNCYSPIEGIKYICFRIIHFQLEYLLPYNSKSFVIRIVH